VTAAGFNRRRGRRPTRGRSLGTSCASPHDNFVNCEYDRR
jgi:hypothetical protein